MKSMGSVSRATINNFANETRRYYIASTHIIGHVGFVQTFSYCVLPSMRSSNNAHYTGMQSTTAQSREENREVKSREGEEEKEEQQPGDKTKEESGSSESEEADIGLVDIPDTPEADSEEEEDIFNTAFVDAITSGDIRLAVIPDDPVYDDQDDPFNTAYAEVIVQKDKVEKRKEANRIKFSGLSSVADVLSGKSDKVDSSLIEHATKRKRRRANRINLIAEQETDVTAREQIGTFDLQKADQAERQPDILITDHNPDNSNLEVGADLLTSTPLPLQSGGKSNPLQLEQDSKADLDLSEFEVIGPDSEDKVALTSNVAILAGEFSKPIEEEEDDFDAAFDALAQESVTRGKLEDLERQFEDADVFDTTSADNVLNLASLTNKVEEIEEPLETFEDKDPFDTSAYEHITGDLETDLDFDSLAKRDPEKEEEKRSEEEENREGAEGCTQSEERGRNRVGQNRSVNSTARSHMCESNDLSAHLPPVKYTVPWRAPAPEGLP